jgi:hypothetical protein
MYQSILHDVILKQEEPKQLTYEMSIKVKPGESINAARISYGLNVDNGFEIINKYGFNIERLADIIPVEQLSWILFGFDHNAKCIRIYFERPNPMDRGVNVIEPTGVCNEYICNNDNLIMLDEMKIYYWSYDEPFETKTLPVRELMDHSRYYLTAYKKTKRGLEWYAYYINHKNRTINLNMPNLLRIASPLLNHTEYLKLVGLLSKYSKYITTWISFGRNGSFNIYFREHKCPN